ncbi:hypothetical protein MASR2M78_16350 [Treponema sp.]
MALPVAVLLVLVMAPVAPVAVLLALVLPILVPLLAPVSLEALWALRVV